jgi:membrane associated rhomboid family serine protease
MFNVAWPVLALIALLAATHAARTLLGIAPERFALISESLAAGRPAGLVTHLFVHGSWTHLAMNCAFTLAFGAPVARFFGVKPLGAALFLLFFLVCGILAALGYAGLETALAAAGRPPVPWALLGASGAASGLMGAAARLIEGRGRLRSMTGRTVVIMTFSWIVMNAVLGLSGLTPGAAGMPVAWEAHIFGYIAGLMLIGPFAWLATFGAPRPPPARPGVRRT